MCSSIRPGHDQVAGGILRARRRIALAVFGYAAIGESDPAAINDAIGQNNSGIADNGFRFG